MSNHLRRSFFGFSGSLVLLGLGQGLAGAPSHAADQINLKYGGFARTVSVAELRTYSETDKAPPALKSVLSLAKADQKESLLKGLKTKLPFGVVQVSKLLKSPSGEKILSQVSEVTILPGGSEIQATAISSALILGAASEGGLSVMSFLEAYPTPVMTVDLKALTKLLSSGSGLGGLLGGFGGLGK